VGGSRRKDSAVMALLGVFLAVGDGVVFFPLCFVFLLGVAPSDDAEDESDAEEPEDDDDDESALALRFLTPFKTMMLPAPSIFV